jgi:hypothetical protein
LGGAFFDSHAASGDEQPIAHAIAKMGKNCRIGELRHFGTLLSFSHGQTKKSAAVWRKCAIFLALWLF